MKKGHTYVQWLVAFVAELTLTNYGLQAGWVSPMRKVLQSPSSPAGRPITDMEMTLIASMLPLAATAGVPLFVYLADNHGRKVGVLVVAIMQSMCWIIKLSTTSATSLIIANMFAGIPAGGCFQLIPVYVKEIGQDSIRGMLVVMFLLMQNIGVLTIFAIGAYLDYFTVLWIVLAISLLAVAALIKAPESPAFLVKMGKIEEAASTIALLRGLDPDDKAVQSELDLLKEDDRHYKTLPDVTIRTILSKKSSRTGLLLVLMVISAQALNGTFALFTYASSILTASDVTLSPELQTLSIPIVMIIGSFMCMSCVEMIGRKVILAVTFALTTSALVCLGILLTIKEQGGNFPSWLPVVAIVTSVWSYAVGILPMPYVIMSEIFNFQVRAKVAGCAVTWAWLISFVQLFVFIPMTSLFGLHNTMFGFAAVNLYGLVCGLALLPETRGKSLDEIEKILEKK